MKICDGSIGDSLFLSCGKKNEIEKLLSAARNKIAEDLNLVDHKKFSFVGLLITDV